MKAAPGAGFLGLVVPADATRPERFCFTGNGSGEPATTRGGFCFCFAVPEPCGFVPGAQSGIRIDNRCSAEGVQPEMEVRRKLAGGSGGPARGTHIPDDGSRFHHVPCLIFLVEAVQVTVLMIVVVKILNADPPSP